MLANSVTHSGPLVRLLASWHVWFNVYRCRTATFWKNRIRPTQTSGTWRIKAKDHRRVGFCSSTVSQYRRGLEAMKTTRLREVTLATMVIVGCLTGRVPADSAPQGAAYGLRVGPTQPAHSGQPWQESFDSYREGARMCGRGGWECWFRDQRANGIVSGLQRRSHPRSVKLIESSDLVYPHLDALTGRWILVAHHFIPSPLNDKTYFILNNEYDGPGGRARWAVQLVFSPSGKVFDDFRPENEVELILDRWAQIRVEVDLDANVQKTFYNGQLLSEGLWTVRGGEVELVNLDLFSNGPTIYYDDISLATAIDCGEPILCDNLLRFRAKCKPGHKRQRRFRIRVTRRFDDPFPNVGSHVFVALDGQQSCLEFLEGQRRVKLKSKKKGITGDVLAELLLPESCRPPQLVNCEE